MRLCPHSSARGGPDTREPAGWERRPSARLRRTRSHNRMGARKRSPEKILAAAVCPRCPIYPRISDPRCDMTTAASSPPTSALAKIRSAACPPLSPEGVSPTRWTPQSAQRWTPPSAEWTRQRKAPGSAFHPSRYPRAPARAVRRDPRAFLLPSDFALRLHLPVVMTLLRARPSGQPVKSR